MDWSQVSRSQWIVVGGTIATLIGALFLDWYSITVSLGSLGHISASTGAWDANALGKLAVIGSLVMLAGAILMFIPNTLQHLCSDQVTHCKRTTPEEGIQECYLRSVCRTEIVDPYAGINQNHLSVLIAFRSPSQVIFPLSSRAFS